MKGRILKLGAMAFAGSAIVAGASANLVSNGSFEDGVIGANTFRIVANGDSFITDWTVTGTSVDVVSGPATWIAADGNQSIDLAGTPGPGGVSQMIATTNGTAYRIRFALSRNDQGGSVADKDVDFMFGSYTENLLGAVQNSWTYFERTVVADSSSTELRFSSDSAGFFGGLVDDVSVEVVPEPASMAALTIGALGLIARRRRK